MGEESVPSNEFEPSLSTHVNQLNRQQDVDLSVQTGEMRMESQVPSAPIIFPSMELNGTSSLSSCADSCRPESSHGAVDSGFVTQTYRSSLVHNPPQSVIVPTYYTLDISRDSCTVVNVGHMMNTLNGNGMPHMRTRSSTITFRQFSTNNHNRSLQCSNRSKTLIDTSMVQWLLENFEPAEGCSLRRSTLYNLYIRHCYEKNFDAVNPASFGKLIRSVFIGLKTRRLGTRGNSKYHYYGIRIKANSPLSQFIDEHHIFSKMKMCANNKRFLKLTRNGVGVRIQGCDMHYKEFSESKLPPFFTCDDSFSFSNITLPENLCNEDFEIFNKLYREHCERLMNSVANLQFQSVEHVLKSFWRYPGEDSQIFEKQLNNEKFLSLCSLKQIKDYTEKCDAFLYQSIIDLLMPDVLKPMLSVFTSAVRNFSRSFENWMKSAMMLVPDPVKSAKLNSVSVFSTTLRRYTSLNHLAQAARAVFQNKNQIDQMIQDLNKVDMKSVHEQAASWICRCEYTQVSKIETEFKNFMVKHSSLEDWAIWMSTLVDQMLSPFESPISYGKAARSFILKWSFYCSVVIRDLTLRSAASFGSFHLIRLLFDEYLVYVIEHRLAQIVDKSPLGFLMQLSYPANLIYADTATSMDSETFSKVSSSSEVASDSGNEESRRVKSSAS